MSKRCQAFCHGRASKQLAHLVPVPRKFLVKLPLINNLPLLLPKYYKFGWLFFFTNTTNPRSCRLGAGREPELATSLLKKDPRLAGWLALVWLALASFSLAGFGFDKKGSGWLLVGFWLRPLRRRLWLLALDFAKRLWLVSGFGFGFDRKGSGWLLAGFWLALVWLGFFGFWLVASGWLLAGFWLASGYLGPFLTPF